MNAAKIKDYLETLRLVKGDGYSMAVSLLAQYAVVHAPLTGSLKTQVELTDTQMLVAFSVILKTPMESLIKDACALIRTAS